MPKKKGFTLIEIMVVMGIMAVLAIIGVATILSTRNSSQIDSYAQGLLDQVRETQNRSIAVTKNSNGDIPVVWGLHIRSNGYDVLSYYPDTNNSNKITPTGFQDPVDFSTNTTLQIIKDGADYTKSEIYIYYTAPFGKIYVSDDNCGASSCVWSKNTNLTGDFTIPPSLNIIGSTTTNIGLKISDGKYSKTISITGNGDSYAD